MKSFNINKTQYYIDDTLENNNFVGIKIVNNEYHLCFPIGYDVKNMDELYYKKILRYLYKTVLLTRNVDVDKKSGNNLEHEKNIPMDSYIYILSDYFSNGSYKNSEVKFKNDYSGNINWNKTFKNKFYIQDDSPLYLDTVIRYNKRESNIITLLQLYAVNKAIDILMFMGDFNRPFSELTDDDINSKINYYNSVIDKEIRNTNNDKKQLLLVNIRNIINDCNCSDKTIRSYGTTNYEYAFEKMINRVFGSEKDLSMYYPTSLWFLDGDKKGFESSKLREDTIWRGKGTVYIIDSKYYRYGVIEDVSLLPKTSAIHKQIVYGDYVYNKLLKTENKKYKVYNVFVIPSNKDEFLEYKGYSKMKLLDNDKDFKFVYLLFVNMNDLIDNYFSKDCHQIDKMIQIIEKNKIN